jgi:ferritin heavy chain
MPLAKATVLLFLFTFVASQSQSTPPPQEPGAPDRDLNIRQNYRKETEDGVNKQIVVEMKAFYMYRDMAYYFDRSDVALPGFFKFFKEASDEELEHADKLREYQNKRGGTVRFDKTVLNSNIQSFTPTQAMQWALDTEKHVNAELLKLHKVAEKHNDAHLMDFLEGEYLDEQVESIRKIGDYVTQMKRTGPGLGEYLFDKYLKDDEKAHG